MRGRWSSCGAAIVDCFSFVILMIRFTHGGPEITETFQAVGKQFSHIRGWLIYPSLAFSSVDLPVSVFECQLVRMPVSMTDPRCTVPITDIGRYLQLRS
jgi:hypothetical protein